MSVAITEIAGKYRYLLELGEGGTANVYLAVAHGPSGFNKLVVMKTLRPSLVNDPECVRMFLTEARLAARLNHPNIVQTNEVTEDGATPSIVMEYLEGQPLSTINARARATLPLGIQLRALIEVLNALHYAHELANYDGSPLGLVHRDVTPHNVFLTFDGQVKLLDFGIAKVATADAHTQAGIVKGKARYMAPEQIAGTPIDRRADIFSVGVMLWEALVGERMWKGQSDITVMNKVLKGEILGPASVRPDIRSDLDRICCKALSADREDRYATAEEFQAELEAAATSMSGNGLTSNREIGRFVSELFADIRSEVKLTIDKQLREIGSLSWGEYHAQVVKAPPLSYLTQPPTGSHKRTMTDSLNRPTTTDSTFQQSVEPTWLKRNRWVLYVAGAVGVFLLLGSVWYPRLTTDKSLLVAQEFNAPVALASKSTAQDDSPTIRLKATPVQAQIFLDGDALPTNPYARAITKGPHLVRVEAEGYLPKSEAVIVEKNVDYTVALERAKTPPAKAPVEHVRRVSVPAARDVSVPAAKAKAARTTSNSVVSPQLAANCSMPYFIDERGIKKIKPDCM